MKLKGFKSIIVLMLALALIVGSFPTASYAAKKSKSITVSSQKELEKALKSGKYTKITLSTDAKGKITVPKGDFGNVKLVIKAPNATIKNKSNVKKLTIADAKSFTEYASGNTISISDNKLKFTTSKDAEVKSLAVAAKDAAITIANNGSIKKVDVTKPATLKIVEKGEGTVGKLYLNAETDVSISGKNAAQTTVAVYDGGAGSSIASSVDVKLVAYADADVKLSKGAENSNITVKNEDVKLDVQNKTGDAVEIATPDGKTAELASGDKADFEGSNNVNDTATDPGESADPAKDPASTDTPQVSPTPSDSGSTSGGTGTGSGSSTGTGSGTSGGTGSGSGTSGGTG